MEVKKLSDGYTLKEFVYSSHGTERNAEVHWTKGKT